MPKSYNAAVAYDNLADRGIVTASSSLALTPPSLLQDPHVARKWRSGLADSAYVNLDLGSVVLVDTVAMVGLNLNTSGHYRVRASTADSSAMSGDSYDSGDVYGRVSSRYGYLVDLSPTPVLARYVRVDLSQPGAQYVQAGRLFVGRRWQFEYNFDYGWQRQYVDRSRFAESRGGQTYIDADVTLRQVTVAFGMVTDSERYDFVEEVDRVNGTHADVLLLTQPDTDHPGRDSLWGLLSSLDPVTQTAMLASGQRVYSRSYTVKERL